MESLKYAVVDHQFSHNSLQRKTHIALCQGNGEAAKLLDALLVQTKMSFWPHSVYQANTTWIPSGIPSSKTKTSFWPHSAHQANTTWIPTGIPSSKTKTMHKRLHEDRIEKQLFKILYSIDVKLQAQQCPEDSTSIILMAKSKTEWKM